MEKVIDFQKTVYELSKECPEVIEIMKELGFDQIANAGMLNTAGRIMTIPTGAAMKKMDMERIREAFRSKGYEVKE